MFHSIECRFRRRRRTLRHICGKLDGLPGPNSREKRRTLSGLKSGNISRTSTFAYLEGSIAARGVDNFFSLSAEAVKIFESNYLKNTFNI